MGGAHIDPGQRVRRPPRSRRFCRLKFSGCPRCRARRGHEREGEQRHETCATSDLPRRLDGFGRARAGQARLRGHDRELARRARHHQRDRRQDSRRQLDRCQRLQRRLVRGHLAGQERLCDPDRARHERPRSAARGGPPPGYRPRGAMSRTNRSTTGRRRSIITTVPITGRIGDGAGTGGERRNGRVQVALSSRPRAGRSQP